MNRIPKIFPFFFIFLCYLFLKTGIHGDELFHSGNVPSWTFRQLLTLNFPERQPPYMFYNLPAYYMDYFQYYFFGNREIFYEIMKVVVSFFSVSLSYIFFKDYMPNQKAFLLAGIFVLFPLHDSVNYLLQNAQYLLITFGLVMYSHALINNNRLKCGLLTGVLGSFFSYASPPFVWGLSSIFLMRKEYKKFLIFVIPQIFYTLYVFIFSRILALEKVRAVDIDSLPRLIKQFILQVLTFIDVAVGPSFWLKIYYSITGLSVLSAIIGILTVFLFYKFYSFGKERFNFHLFYAFLAIAVLSFCIYATTGYYPQIAFNLGNRTVIYGSLLLSLLVVSLLSLNRKASLIIFSVLLFSILGISDHWKDWNGQQKLIADNFAHNRDIIGFDTSEQLFVSHNQYSRLGAMSHIEFFTEGAGLNILTRNADKKFKISTLNRRFYLSGDELVDRKWGTRITVGVYIYVYDSKADKLLKIEKDGIQDYIDSLPPDYRHWIQMIDNKFINSMIIKLMPRLKYAFG